MEGDKLYSIKWYRNGHEFYRYIPSDEPKTTVFNGDGINVDVRLLKYCLFQFFKYTFWTTTFFSH
jgi:hypothetical protein